MENAFKLTGSDPSKTQIIKTNQLSGCITFSSAVVRGDLLHHTAVGIEKYSIKLNQFGGVISPYGGSLSHRGKSGKVTHGSISYMIF